MNITLIQAPIATGTTQKGMALAPERYLQAGADQSLASRGHSVETSVVARTTEDDLEAVVEVNTGLAAEVRKATEAGRFPMVLGGACNVCLGVLAGLSPRTLGIVWFDAHGDFNTPDTTPSGYFDGMPLAIAAGRGHQDLRTRITEGDPVPEERVLLSGMRDLDPGERDSLESSEVRVVSTDSFKQHGMERSLLPALRQLATFVDEVYLHLDMDVLDPEVAPGVNFPTPGGMMLDDLQRAIEMIGEHFRIAAASVTAYDPTRDEGDRTLLTGLSLLDTVAKAAGKSSSAIRVIS